MKLTMDYCRFGRPGISYYFIFNIKVKLIKYLISGKFLGVNELHLSIMNLYQIGRASLRLKMIPHYVLSGRNCSTSVSIITKTSF